MMEMQIIQIRPNRNRKLRRFVYKFQCHYRRLILKINSAGNCNYFVALVCLYVNLQFVERAPIYVE